MTSSSDTVARPAPRRVGALRWQRCLPFLGYLAVQGFCTAGLTTLNYPDSAQYLPLSFTGNAPNLWTVPLLYSIFPNDPLRITAQVVIAAICWWVLARVAAGLVNEPRVRMGIRLVILALGVVGPIVSWNSIILSESTAISLTALMIAGWLNYTKRPSWPSGAAAVAATVLWVFTRQAQVVLSLIILLFALVALARKRNLLTLGVAAALFVTSAYGVEIVGRGHYVSNGNVADIIEDWILPNPTWTTWFVLHGMPYTTAVAQSVGGQFGDALLAIPQFDDWLTADGTHVYLEFMATHPSYTLLHPLPDFSGELASLHEQNTSGYSTQPNPTPSMLSPSAYYGRYRAVLPSVLEELLFEQGQIGSLLFLGAGAFGLAYVARRRLGPDRRMWIPMLVLATVIPNGYLVYLGGGPGEIDRNSMELATSLRIALWLVFAFALDRVLLSRGRVAAKEPAPVLEVAVEDPLS